MSETPVSPHPVRIMAAPVDLRALEARPAAMKTQGVVDGGIERERRRVLVTDTCRLEAGLIEHLKTLGASEGRVPTWRERLPDGPQFRPAGIRPLRRKGRR